MPSSTFMDEIGEGFTERYQELFREILSREPNKSLAARFTQLKGRENGGFAIIDEFAWTPKKLAPLGPGFSYTSKLYPVANVDIYRIDGGRNDPRNPNPASGFRTYYIIKVGDRRVGAEYASLALAKAAAAPMHQKLVEALQKNAKSRHVGRF